jgi:hypothetical protein
MVGVIDCIVGASKIAFVREVRLRDEHDGHAFCRIRVVT